MDIWEQMYKEQDEAKAERERIEKEKQAQPGSMITKTLAQWAKELGMNNFTDHSEDDILFTKEAALGKLDRAALARKAGRFAGWLGKKLGNKKVQRATDTFAAQRVEQLKQAGNAALAQRMQEFLESKQPQKSNLDIDQEIQNMEQRAEYARQLRRYQDMRAIRGYITLLKRMKQEEVEKNLNRVRP